MQLKLLILFLQHKQLYSKFKELKFLGKTLSVLKDQEFPRLMVLHSIMEFQEAHQQLALLLIILQRSNNRFHYKLDIHAVPQAMAIKVYHKLLLPFNNQIKVTNKEDKVRVQMMGLLQVG